MKFEDYGYDCDPPCYTDQVEFLSREEAVSLYKLGLSVCYDLHSTVGNYEWDKSPRRILSADVDGMYSKARFIYFLIK